MDFTKELLIKKVKFFNGPEVELKTYVIVDNLKNLFIRFATDEDIKEDNLHSKQEKIKARKEKINNDF